jgi:hypothetical protein
MLYGQPAPEAGWMNFFQHTPQRLWHAILGTQAAADQLPLLPASPGCSLPSAACSQKLRTDDAPYPMQQIRGCVPILYLSAVQP